ncbi:uncharacterized protein LOC135102979 isoform X2 [Scylla paramamosain]|uniref:uncharacterized protein LOC135102979 isoform X2 n=1 Tax=Scylla paramamosain TaxID=85552 RepID=UPI0030838D69
MLWLAVDVPSAAAVASESCSAVKSVYQAQGFRETVPSQPISGERVGGCRARDTASTRQVNIISQSRCLLQVREVLLRKCIV